MHVLWFIMQFESVSLDMFKIVDIFLLFWFIRCITQNNLWTCFNWNVWGKFVCDKHSNCLNCALKLFSSGYTKYSIDEYKPPGIPFAEEVQTGSVKLSLYGNCTKL